MWGTSSAPPAFCTTHSVICQDKSWSCLTIWLSLKAWGLPSLMTLLFEKCTLLDFRPLGSSSLPAWEVGDSSELQGPFRDIPSSPGSWLTLNEKAKYTGCPLSTLSPLALVCKPRPLITQKVSYTSFEMGAVDFNPIIILSEHQALLNIKYDQRTVNLLR